MRSLFFLVIASMLSSCAGIKKMIGIQRIVDKKLLEVEYAMTPKQLKSSLKEYFTGWRSLSSDYKKELGEEISKGFSYKGKFQASRQPQLMSLINVAWADDKKRAFDNLFSKDPFFTLSEDENGFMIVEGNHVYKAKANGASKTKLRVYRIDKIYRGPLKLELDIIGILTKARIFSLEDGGIILDKSIEEMTRSSQQETLTLKALDENKYNEIRAQASKAYEEGVRI